MILVLACAPDTHVKDALFFTKIEPLGPPLGIFQDPDKRTIYLFTFRSNFISWCEEVGVCVEVPRSQ